MFLGFQDAKKCKTEITNIVAYLNQMNDCLKNAMPYTHPRQIYLKNSLEYTAEGVLQKWHVCQVEW